MKILKMGQQELLNLRVEDIHRYLTPKEVVHMAKVMDAFWTFNYQAAKQGKPGLHALLKSGRHSDGFFVSRILLEPENIRRIISAQIAMRVRDVLHEMPASVAGVPDGATKLGEDIAEIFGARKIKMKKDESSPLKSIKLISTIYPGESVLLVEDFCTRGTGFTEAVMVIMASQPEARILPYDPVIINRGGLKEILIDEAGDFTVLPVVEWRVKDWEDVNCPLCKMGSKPIKPKLTDENWRLITTSQL